MFVIDTIHGPGIVVARVLVTLAVLAWVLGRLQPAAGRRTDGARDAVCGTFAINAVQSPPSSL